MRHTIKNTHHLTNAARCLSHWQHWLLTLSFIIYHLSFSVAPCVAQINIGGSVYGGGNVGNMTGNSNVTVHAGDINKVFGGARQANVGGHAFVHIDGEHASDYIVINYAYGGNDISGTIGSSAVPAEITNASDNEVDNSWNAFVRITTKTETTTTGEGEDAVTTVTEADDAQKIYIGQLFGGGNGDYVYDSSTTTTGEGDDAVTTTTYIVKDKTTGTEIVSNSTGFSKPNLGKTYLELLGGSIVYAYGGGNNATVTGETKIYLDNPSKVVNSIIDANNPNADATGELLTDTRFSEKMGINMGYSFPSSDGYQIGSFFGGNNTAEMAIRPKWNLQQGKIRNLYSGGNRGRMTSPEGLLLNINPATKLHGITYDPDNLVIENVYGGCRMADVFPSVDGLGVTYSPTTNIEPYNFPPEFSARLVIHGGHITNVYGGNDIRGKVYGGNAVGIRTTIYGDVYGGGNGSYPYTDNAELATDQTYGDFYYDPGSSSVDALNAIRPNAEQVSLRLVGTSATDPTIIHGSVYLGGNSATLKPKEGVAKPTVELKIGSYVIADKVFLGNNGENMVKTNVEDRDNYVYEGVLRAMQRTDLTSSGKKFNSIDLTDAATFAEYMKGAAMEMLPRVVFDGDTDTDGDNKYIEHTSYFGSFYCGGNVGSLIKDGCKDITFSHKVVIFDKLVGGCNNAIVPQQQYYEEDSEGNKTYTEGKYFNARYEGGLLGDAGDNGNKLKLNLSGLLVEPRRWKATPDASSTFPDNYLEWNTWSSATNEEVTPVTTLVTDAGKDYRTSDADDLNRRFEGGNIYGGCYTSGIVNGNVVINVDGTIIEQDVLFDKVASDELGEEVSLYGSDQTTDTEYHITERRSGVILGQQGMDVLGKALNIFGGGKGRDTEIWGSTTINLNKGYVFQVFGGSEEGVIGKPVLSGNAVVSTTESDGTYLNGTYHFNHRTYQYSDAYGCTVNLKGSYEGVSKGSKTGQSPDMADVEFLYGGGFLGPICGNTVINLGKGRIFNSFGGSCNADILGHTETYIGQQIKDDGTVDEKGGFPWVRDIVYGGNDLGGKIYGKADYSARVTSFAIGKMYDGTNGTNGTTVSPTTASSYVEYLQGRADGIFGGCYGTYDYTDSYFNDYFYASGASDIGTNVPGSARPGYSKPYMENAFVNFRPSFSNERNVVNMVYGAGQGWPGDRTGDQMQDRSYVLVDIPQDMTYYTDMEVFGAGSFNGLGMRKQYQPASGSTPASDVPFNESAAVIDLLRGQIGSAYGGSFNEGNTRHTLVNVPTGSTIRIGSIFGGAYGADRLKPCDVYDANVEYHSSDAWLVCNPVRTEKEKITKEDGTEEEVEVTVGNSKYTGAIYGGNNAHRRTIYSHINIDVPLNMNHYKYGNTTGYIYGAGFGPETWAEYTEVNLAPGAVVYEAYGGGEQGLVLNAESTEKYIDEVGQLAQQTAEQERLGDNTYILSDDVWAAAWVIGGGYDPTPVTTGNNTSCGYASNMATSLSNTLTGYNGRPLVRTAELDDRATKTYKYNANVIVNRGVTVNNYAYGGGLGNSDNHTKTGSGDIYGTTYIALLGGEVKKDIYAAGTVGAVYNAFGANFTASTTAYIAGGTLRNVYGGGWQGDVGHTPMSYTADGWSGTYDASTERPGETHVVIGIRKDQPSDNLLAAMTKVKGSEATLSDYGFYNGVPAIERNAYAGGEGGAVFGTSHLTLNNGYIGYRFFTSVPTEDFPYYTTSDGYYQEKINDETYYVNQVYAGDDRLRDCGNMFGGGYDVRSCVDQTNVTMYGGVVRNSMHGGGEIATIGRGAVTASGVNNVNRTLNAIYKPGKTQVELFNGHVKRNVFGGGKGYNIWGYGQQGTLYTDGYVFGQTEVHVHGGEVGTNEGVANGYGNVFGGGDIGFVWSGSMMNGTTATGSHSEGTGSPGHYYFKDSNGDLTEDCKVVVSPYLQIKDGGTSVTYDNKTYNAYDYVPTDYLNTIPGKDANKVWNPAWSNLVTEDADGTERGILIHNAVFGGGNVSSNSDTQYANATTVHGNTTATLYDVFHRDFISIGTEHTGGIYGGGNLSIVEGYRELNITNYGTDYYGLDAQITLEEYRTLSNRERAYFQLQYVCNVEEITLDETYKKDQVITEDDYLKLVAAYGNAASNAFTPYGFCSIYAGRLLNTIQRADFCGVFGSRMVLQGAKDRVDDVGEDIDYTINRVGEVSLNQQSSPVLGETDLHGNYFGIYSLVNYMGNLTSDVKFGDDYRDGTGATVDGKTYYSYKKEAYATGTPKSSRNNGSSYNQVALASGVFLELTTENSTADHKDYGYITGVVELDLINVKKDIVGGGFVYAKNEHRVPKYYPNKSNVLLSEYNQQAGNEARTYKRYRYADSAHNTENDPRWADDNWPETNTTEEEKPYIISGETEVHAYTTMVYETSGNFIHPSKRIVDDCYPTNNAYDRTKAPYSEAHYWYVKGEVYIYDQTVSAYTGAANAYSKEVHLPLTITAASHGRLQLLNVKPNLYAYKTVDDNGNEIKIGTKVGSKTYDKVWVNNDNDGYALNEVITWWDWHQMSLKDRQYFRTMTYVNTVACQVDGVDYAAGEYVLDDADLATFKTAVTGSTPSKTLKNAAGESITTLEEVENIFRASNNIGHETGYVLTFDMNTPDIWNDYYTRITTSSTEDNKIRESEYNRLLEAATTDADKQTIIDTWREGPTFTPDASGAYGQRQIQEGDIITKEVYNLSKDVPATPGTTKATVEEAYVATEAVTYDYTYQETYIEDNVEKTRNVTITKTTNAGTAIPASEYTAIATTAQASFAAAYVCTQTIKLAENTYLGYGELKTATEIATLKTTYSSIATDIENAMTPAYICSKAGGYGGQQFNKGTNYSALTAWCSLPYEDRIDSNGKDKFTFNYDAFDILSDPDFLNVTVNQSPVPVDLANTNAPNINSVYHTPYSNIVGVEYQAVYKAPTTGATYTYSQGTLPDGTTYAGETLSDGQGISNEIFEAAVRNDKRHYTKVSGTSGETLYITNDNFVYNGVPYGKGQIVDAEVHTNNLSKVDEVTLTSNDPQYYCYENYEDADGNTVAKGTFKSEAAYAALPNDQKNFVIQGKEPTETTTLYVSSESDILDVSQERVYTVVYQYTYYEEEDDGTQKLTNELHVINIHIQLESGAPSIGQLMPPGTVLPNWGVGLKAPEVKPGLYEVLTNGWELFLNEDDAIHHRNGAPFVNNSTPVYWYQNQKNYIAFYSKTYLGKTYSNYVPLSVANYHDLDAVMNDKEHHFYVDRSDVDRPCKIYIDDRTCVSDATKSELDLLRDFYDLSVLSGSAPEVTNGVVNTGALAGHSLLNSHVGACSNLEFFLRSDVSPKAYSPTATTPSTWTSIGSGTDPCFSGTLHGDGHTISGLTSSLFDRLCGEVYNLGVTGSFTGAGIAETGEGYIENCWVSTTGTPTAGTGHYAVFGNPSRDASDTRGPIQVVNCYYPASNAYTAPASTDHGQATKMPDKAFYNGTVAYNLNGFYLKKRYYDATVPDGSQSGYTSYNFLRPDADGTLPTDMSTAWYPNDYALYKPRVKMSETDTPPYTGATAPYLGYVENRFYDGDFIYAGGTIPESTNIRLRAVTTTEGGTTTTKNYYTPIWPDDYLFFGQRLTYGHVDGRPHQERPTAINRSSERIDVSDVGNRVYRAPAYFRSGNMDVAHFNPAAVFAQTKNGDATVTAYKGMTAIDFTGGNGDVASGYQSGNVMTAPYTAISGGAFFPPLLDDDGLTSIMNVDLTRNLLVYTSVPGSSAAGKTGTVVSNYLTDVAYRETDANYHTVDAWDSYTDDIRGHWVQLSGGSYTAQRDHLLVDKQDFNAPIGYKFGDDYRMWYQRTPDNYVDIEWVDHDNDDSTPLVRTTKGWEGVSLPFKADIVTTDQKGEITHFYNTTAGDTGAGNLGSIGHEYWLRAFTGIDATKSTADVLSATLTYPAANSADGQKGYTNTFLWDYYYSWNDYDDQNGDDYQEKDKYRKYYKEGREYPNYPRLAAAKPYIIGFPGERYYEFDLSGKFLAKTASPTIPGLLGKQTITFASATGASIGVSDSEMTGDKQTYSSKDYTFKPSYLNETFAAGTANTYTLNSDGNSYEVIPSTGEDIVVSAFRPYFTAAASSSGSRPATRSIIFGNDTGIDDLMPHGDQPDGNLLITAKRGKIVVSSTLSHPQEVIITSVGGIHVAVFTIEPGQTIETPISQGGVYIVNQRKVAVSGPR